MISVTCPRCQTIFESAKELAGALDECPMCGSPCPVPNPADQSDNGQPKNPPKNDKRE